MEPEASPLEATSSAALEQSLAPQQHEKSVDVGDDTNLVKDLLKKANGDSAKVSEWLSQMGSNAPSAPPVPTKDAEAQTAGHAGDDIDTVAHKLGAPDTFFCPVSFHLMRDPVLISTGQTYERRAIIKWLAQGTATCPITGVSLSAPVPLTPNVALRKAIEDWSERNAPWMLDSASQKLLPIPNADGHLSSRGNGAKLTVDTVDRDLALALRLQDREVQQMASRTTPPQGTTDHSRAQSYRASNEMAAQIRIRRCMHLLMALTIVHFGVFLFALFRNKWQFENINMNPLIGFSAKVMDEIGATDTAQIADDNQWWRLATSMFVSAGIVHLEGTIGALWTFGRFLSGKLTFVGLGALYFSSGLVGVLLSANISTGVVTSGASAAVFGLIGAMVVELTVHWKSYRMHLASFIVLLAVAAINTIIGLTPLVDNWANIGGFLTGLLAGTALLISHERADGSSLGSYCKCVVQTVFGIAVLIAIVMGASCLLSQTHSDFGENCELCQKMGCYDTKWWKCDAAKILPEDCAFNIQGNLTTSIKCPTGHVEVVSIPEPTQANLEKYCIEICNVRRKTTGLEVPEEIPWSDEKNAGTPYRTIPESDLEVPEGGTKNTLE
ncbi:hypothetical protein BSKO_07438 [Bryopsis sp. KO-2023]|nr:hypothetical protein BSKO_07438 [Bryopsis sp. KO-2023]